MNAELRQYEEFLERLRDDVRDVLLGLTDEGLNWKPLPTGTNSIYNLAQHCAWVEMEWILKDLGKQPFPYEWHGSEELEGTGEDASDLLFWLDEAATSTAATLSALDPSTLDALHTIERQARTFEHTARWIIVHVIEHYAEHIGQMRLTRQLFEASEGA